MCILPGFKKTMEMRRPFRGKNGLATQMMFSDGLAGISVFIENLTGHPNVNSSLTSQGAIQIYSKVNGEYLVTVVGEVPARTLMKVADSIRHSSH